MKTSGKKLEITYEDSPIHFVTKHKYLGVIIENALKM